MINLDKKIIFIHIPKCGGGSIYQLLKSNLELKKNNNGTHSTLSRYVKLYNIINVNDFYKFVVVRNPYKRLYSLYFWYFSENVLKKPSRYKNIYFYKTFSNKNNKPNNFYFEKWIDYCYCKIKNNNVNMNNGDLLEAFTTLQINYITVDNEIKMNDILKFENLNNEFKIVQKKLNITDKLGNVHHINPKGDFNKISDKCKEQIYEIHKLDFINFGYDK